MKAAAWANRRAAGQARGRGAAAPAVTCRGGIVFDSEAGRSLLRAVNAIHAAVGQGAIHARLKEAVLALTGAGQVLILDDPATGPPGFEFGGSQPRMLTAAMNDGLGLCHGWVQARIEPPGRFTPDDDALLQGLAEAAAIALRKDATSPPPRDEPPLDTLNDLAQRLAEVGGWSVDLRTRRAYWTDQKAAIHGLPKGTWLDLDDAIGTYLPDSQAVVSEAFARCAAEGIPYDLELQLETAQGERRWVRTIGVAERDEAGRIIRVNGGFQDISRIKAADERFRITLESLTDALFTLDHDWRFTFVNGEGERLLQRRREDLLGKVVWIEFPEAVGSQFDIEYRRAVTNGQSCRFTEYYPPLERWFRVTAYPSSEGLAVYFQDVTEQRQASEALRESEARFRILAKATTDTVWDWNLTENTFWWGEGGEDLFGRIPPDGPPAADAWSGRIHPEDRERVLLGVQEVLNTGQESWADEYRFRRKDGSYIQVADRGFVISDDSGKPVRMVGGMRDITHRRALEARLSQAQRLEAIGQLTGGVAHDFNNLLTVILGNAEALAESLGADHPRLRRLAEMTREAAERGSDLTQRLLAVARRQPLEPKPVDVVRLLSGMQGLLRQAMGVSIGIVLRHEAEPWPALVDAAQLEAAVLNLSLNARDAMPGGGTLDMCVSNVGLDAAEARTEADLSPGAYLLVEFRDTGSGMAPEILARALEPFYTTKDIGRGSGLGLSTVYGFAKQSGGTLRLASTVNDGTTVRLYLPAAELAMPADIAAATVDLAMPGGAEKILLVEDDGLVRDHVSLQLMRLGYRVVTARSGQEGLQRVLEHPEIDLLFTDIMMPGGMDGGTLAAEVRRIRPGLKVLFTSGYTDEAILGQGRLDPETPLLKKPYRRGELALKLRWVLDGGGRDSGRDGHGPHIADR
ncbi:MAG: PAS domain-containing protein [Sneathiellaceae bacterium]